ncbi:MAG: DegV family protein [Chloroflexota bacterium]|nr:DegV family protein [Chloroflexota bacterium]MDE2896233.1 DegV family protein [Chloroflexota bacterium]
MSVGIVCDSSVDLPDGLLEERGLRTAPVGYSLGATYYSQGQQTHAEFYDALGRGERLTLNGVTSEDWESVFLEAADGCDEGVICLCQAFGSSSPSFDSAEFASRRIEHFHEIDVRIHQTPRSTAGQAAIALALSRVSNAGGDREAVERALDEVSASADIFMLTPDVDGLDRAGELSAVQSQSGIGSLDFGVPVFRARDRVKAVALADDADQAEHMLLDRAADILGGQPAILVVTHALAPEAAARLSEKASARLTAEEIHITELGPTVGGLLGAGAWGLGFCQSPSAPSA